MAQLALTVWLLPRSGGKCSERRSPSGSGANSQAPHILWTAINAALTGFNAAFIAK
jgi:hypothetical protein